MHLGKRIINGFSETIIQAQKCAKRPNAAFRNHWIPTYSTLGGYPKVINKDMISFLFTLTRGIPRGPFVSNGHLNHAVIKSILNLSLFVNAFSPRKKDL